MKKIELSVIVCVYNTEIKLFRECLLSIANSVLKNLDVVIIDDGSSLDYSSLKKEFNNFRWEKIENVGTLKAREFGIKCAKADLICFVDSDDVVSFDYFQGFIEEYNKSKTEIIINDWAFKTQVTHYYCGNDSTICQDFVCKNDDVLHKYFQSSGYEHSYFVVWNKSFSKNVLLKAYDKINALQIGKLVFSEDVLMTYFCFSLAKSLCNIHVGYYFYRIHNSQQINITSKQKLENQINSNAIVFNAIEKDLKKNNLYNEFNNNLKKWINLIACHFGTIAIHTKNEDIVEKIQNLYNQKNIRKMPKKADYFYGNHKLLPLNFLDIDNHLKEIFEKKEKNCIIKCNKKSYTYKRICELNKYLGFDICVSFKYNKNVILFPTEKFSLKQKIIHNDICYQIGIRLFPKGSKIRKFLKTKF